MRHLSDKLEIFTISVSFFGFLNALYLFVTENILNIIPSCKVGSFFDCGKVAQSLYSYFLFMPVSFWGVLFFSFLTILIFLGSKNNIIARYLAIVFSVWGVVFSLYLTYLELFVIHALCLYCVVSFILSILTFVFIITLFNKERKSIIIFITHIVYKIVIKNILFLFDAEKVHTATLSFGRKLGRSKTAKISFSYLYKISDDRLVQTIHGITFKNPIGLAAGFDYEAYLPEVLPSLGFGFETVGTVTYMPYKGNRKPRLGRLPKSRSLLVNKGFKSAGSKKIVQRLNNKKFQFPLGISIGRTNTSSLDTQRKSIKDIINCFQIFEKSKVHHDYYELNISCPNLKGTIEFYSKKNLNQLLNAVDSLLLTRPYFIKMPIDKSDKEVLIMLDVIARHKAVGVIFGNLQKNRSHPALDAHEVAQFKKGNFSGKPTFERSNELISLCFKHFKNRFVIVGCGGVFSAEDALKKILHGANLVQLITGLVFEGPQLVSEINNGLLFYMQKFNTDNITRLVGRKELL